LFACSSIIQAFLFLLRVGLFSFFSVLSPCFSLSGVVINSLRGADIQYEHYALFNKSSQSCILPPSSSSSSSSGPRPFPTALYEGNTAFYSGIVVTYYPLKPSGATDCLLPYRKHIATFRRLFSIRLVSLFSVIHPQLLANSLIFGLEATSFNFSSSASSSSQLRARFAPNAKWFAGTAKIDADFVVDTEKELVINTTTTSTGRGVGGSSTKTIGSPFYSALKPLERVLYQRVRILPQQPNCTLFRDYRSVVEPVLHYFNSSEYVSLSLSLSLSLSPSSSLFFLL
jgi:hypothetical protein